jgi:hypothetical protein
MDDPVIGEHAVAAFRRFYTLLPKSDDASLVILKLHLLVEEQIRAFVDERLRSPEALKAAKLDCHQVICLAESLAGESVHHRFWEAARKLNELRNKIAHNLEPSGVIERMKNINSMLGRNPINATTPSELLEQFEFSVSTIYHCISGFVQRKPAEVLHLKRREDGS